MERDPRGSERDEELDELWIRIAAVIGL